MTEDKARILGEEPHRYTFSRNGQLSEPAILQNYALSTQDSFETGGGYSLHLSRKDAEEFPYETQWYKKVGDLERVFVSPLTIRELKQGEPELFGGIFISWEN
jgi:hypothetical protein